MKADKGTQELQEKREAWAGMRRSGLRYLHEKGTLNAEQYGAGVIYAATFAARYANDAPKSCLANLCHIPTQEAFVSSERWLALMSICDAQTLHGRISGRLAKKAFYARGQKWHQIVEHVAGHDDWSVKDVCSACGVGSDTARMYIRRAFDALVECIAELEREGQKH